MRILIVEDEYNLADVIKDKLKKEKYSVDVCNDGEEGLYSALSGIYNLIILDVMLPGVNGLEILKRIREEEIDTKVIMLTAKSELEDKLSGLNLGADDYITKPFHIEELIARVNVQLKRDNSKKIKDILEYGDLKLNLKSSTITNSRSEESIEIGLKELQILEYLMKNTGIFVSKDQLYDKIWGLDNEIESNNLEVYLSFIRKKLKLIDSKVNIKVSRGIGYKLEVKDE